MSKGVAKKATSSKKHAPAKKGRYPTSGPVKEVVWIRAAGHCEQCGTDLTRDLRIGKTMRWAQVAHIMPASPKGPRAPDKYTVKMAKRLTDEVSNLMLLCPGCHTKIDTDPEGYPLADLTDLHAVQIARIRVAATAPNSCKAVGLIVLGQHWQTKCDIRNVDLLAAMSAEGLEAIGEPIRLIIPEPGPRGRDSAYWQGVIDRVDHHLGIELRRVSSAYGDIPALAVAGLADIPALMRLGVALGDRSNRHLFSLHRTAGLAWPDKAAGPPAFHFTPPPPGDGPIALVLSLSGKIALDDVSKALPAARMAIFTVSTPDYGLILNRGTINAFRDALQPHLSQLEAEGNQPIHVFPAIPAAMAIEFGALQSTQYKHRYEIYDRDDNNTFVRTLSLGNPPA